MKRSIILTLVILAFLFAFRIIVEIPNESLKTFLLVIEGMFIWYFSLFFEKGYDI